MRPTCHFATSSGEKCKYFHKAPPKNKYDNLIDSLLGGDLKYQHEPDCPFDWWSNPKAAQVFCKYYEERTDDDYAEDEMKRAKTAELNKRALEFQRQISKMSPEDYLRPFTI